MLIIIFLDSSYFRALLHGPATTPTHSFKWAFSHETALPVSAVDIPRLFTPPSCWRQKSFHVISYVLLHTRRHQVDTLLFRSVLRTVLWSLLLVICQIFYNGRRWRSDKSWNVWHRKMYICNAIKTSAVGVDIKWMRK